MKDVMISIRGTQIPFHEGPDGRAESEPIELVTDGSYEYEGNGGWFTYRESELTGMDGTVTTFRVENDSVMLTREGSVNSQMLFRQGQKHLFLYDTPFGSLTMGIDTQKLQTELNEHGGRMDIVYSVDYDSVPIGKNTFRIAWKEIENEGDHRI